MSNESVRVLFMLSEAYEGSRPGERTGGGRGCHFRRFERRESRQDDSSSLVPRDSQGQRTWRGFCMNWRRGYCLEQLRRSVMGLFGNGYQRGGIHLTWIIGLLIAGYGLFKYATNKQKNPVTGEAQHVAMSPKEE